MLSKKDGNLLGDKSCEDLGLLRRVYDITTATDACSNSGDTSPELSGVFKGFYI